jgi:hypothetical protein
LKQPAQLASLPGASRTSRRVKNSTTSTMVMRFGSP